MPEITDRTKHDHISGFGPILVYRLIATERRLTFDILSQDISTIRKAGEEPITFVASNEIVVRSQNNIELDPGQICLCGSGTADSPCSSTLTFYNNDERDEAHAAFTKALNEWAVFNKGRGSSCGVVVMYGNLRMG